MFYYKSKPSILKVQFDCYQVYQVYNIASYVKENGLAISLIINKLKLFCLRVQMPYAVDLEDG